MADDEGSRRTIGSFGRFLRRHSRTLQALGILAVLATFIVRDVMREPVKSFSDDLSAAHRIFAIRKDLGRMRGQLDDLIRRSYGDSGSGKASFSNAQLRIELSDLSQANYSSLLSAQTYCELAKSMSQAADRNDACSRVKSAQMLAEELSRIRDNIERKFRANESDRRKAFFQDIRNRYFALSNDVDFGGENIIDRADKEGEQSMRRYEILTMIYDTLFVVGLALGALGTFFDIKGVASGG